MSPPKLDLSLLELLPVAVCECDAATLRVRRQNRRAAELFGIHAGCALLEQPLYLPDGLLLPPDQHPAAETVSTGRPVRGRTLVVTRPDGRRIPMLISTEPVRDESGTLATVLCVLQEHPREEPPPLDRSGEGVRTALREEEKIQQRLAFLAEASSVLSASLDFDTTLEHVAKLVVPHLADWCTVHVLEEGGEVRQVAVAHSDPEKIRWALELRDRHPYDPDAPRGLPNVIRTGEPELYPEITDEMLVAGAVDSEHLSILRQVGFTSLVIVPMLARGRVLGGITLISAESGYRYGPDDVLMAEDLATRAAMAIDNARLYGEAQDALAALSQSEERFRSLIQASSAIVWSTPASGDFESDQPAWRAFTGQGVEELRGRGWLNAVHPKDRERSMSAWSESLATRSPCQVQLRLRRYDGEYRQMVARAVPILDGTGEVREWVGVHTDVTEESRVRQQADALAAVNRTITENATAALFMIDLEGQCTFMNPAAETMTGFTAEEIRGQPFHEAIHHSHPDGTPYPRSECPIDQALMERRRLRRHEDVMVRKNGTLFPVRCSAEPIFDGDTPVGTVVEVRDITEEKLVEAERLQLLEREQERSEQLRKLAEAAVRVQASATLREMVESITSQARDIVGAHQAVTSLFVAEDRMEHLHAVSLSAKYAAWQEKLPPGQPPAPWTILCPADRPMRLTPSELEAELERQDSHADSIPLPPMRGCLAAPLTGRDGQSLGVIQLSDKCQGDFTEEDEAVLRQLAQMAAVAIEKERLYEEIRCADAQKDEFLAMLAHELRNPLAPILNATEVLRASRTEDHVIRRHQQIIERQARHMARLLDDLLDAARITRGLGHLQKERLDLVQAIRQAADDAGPLMEARGHALRVDLPEAPVWVDADPTRLHQIADNLLNNAAKYTPDGGQVQVTVRVEGGEAIFCVRDNGRGIPAAVLPRVFDLFTQGDRSLARSESGLGVGLTMVQRLVQLHEGRVTAHSEGEGRGSEFTVSLPLAPDDFRIAHWKDRISETAFHRQETRTVLVVDDNRDAAETLADLIELWGHGVRTAFDGTSALALAEELRPDVILLDIGMPGMDGYEVARRLRAVFKCRVPDIRDGGSDGSLESPDLEAKVSNPRSPVIVALTGYGQERDRAQALEAGFDHHLTKPVDPETLKCLLAKLSL